MKAIIQQEMQKNIQAFRLPRFDEITNVGLYLEQTVKFVNVYLLPLGGFEITASMVSNYVKHRLIPKPEKKLYGQTHIASLIYVALCKPVLALEDIRTMFAIQQQFCAAHVAYDSFCASFEQALALQFGLAPQGKAADAPGEFAERDLLYATVNAIVQKVYLEQYLATLRKLSAQQEQG